MSASPFADLLPRGYLPPCADPVSVPGLPVKGAHASLTPGASDAPAPLLVIDNVSKSFRSIAALNGITFSVPRGATLALLGPNGAGKSTLFGCLLGLVHPSAGQIHFQSSSGQADRGQSASVRMGYVAERVALYPQRTVLENGLFFSRLKNHSRCEFERQLQRVGLAGVANRPVRQLSKGMLQRLGLAIALCGEPDMLVLDEPFNGLDPALLEGLQRILADEAARGVTLLISTHTMSAVEPLATHAAILLAGRLAAFGTLEQLRAKYPGEGSLERIYHRIACENRASNLEAILK